MEESIQHCNLEDWAGWIHSAQPRAVPVIKMTCPAKRRRHSSLVYSQRE